MSLLSWLENIGATIKRDVTNSVDSFLSSAIGKETTSITNKVRKMIDDAMKGVAGLVHDAAVKVEEAKFHLSKDLQSAYNTTLGFWAILGSVIIGIIILPKAVTWAIKAAQSTKLYAQIIKLVGDAKSWSGWQAVNLVVEANRVAIVLFKNWRDIWQGIYVDVETIAGDIGIGIGALAAVTTASKALLTTIYNLSGANEISAEAAALGQMQGWLSGLSSRFDRYAQNPQQIWNDLWSEVLLPAQKNVREYNSSVLAAIDKINSTILTLEKLPKEFVAYQDSVQKLLNVKMSASEAKVEKSILKQVNGMFDTYNKDVADKIAAIKKSVDPLITATDNRIQQIEAANKKLQTDITAKPNIPSVITTSYLTSVLGTSAAITVSYMLSDQFPKDVTSFMDYTKKATDLNMGLITPEQFTEYVNGLAQYRLPVVNPIAV